MGWNDPWAHTPSHFRPYHVEYAATTEPSRSRQPYSENDRFKQKDRSNVQKEKKVVKKVYRVKRDGRKGTSSDLNSINEKPIGTLSPLASNGKDEEKLAIDPPSVKFEQKKLKKQENKERAMLSKIEARPSRPLGLSNWQKKKGMAWVPIQSIQTQSKDDVQAKGAAQLKEKRKFERQSPKLRFAPNHQNYWSLRHPFALQMPYLPISWNSSLDMFGYPSHTHFDPWVPHGSLHRGGLSPSCYAR
uniref:Uncharacterized protein n=1 Tax=Setaria viridis TaxID=4556 RepID=A0A4U6U4B1_SETVI|nr:hypothetical protein SEVIR_6G031100v2 [Setaria viridis]